MFHPQAEGSKLQRDLRAYLEAVKGDTHEHTSQSRDTNTQKLTFIGV